MRRRRPGTAVVAGGAAFLLVIALGLGAMGNGDYPRVAEAAPLEALARVKARNEQAAAVAAARMRAESEQRAKAADAARARDEAAQGR